MPVIHKVKIVPYTRQQMYALVNDVDNYAEFVPWCVESRVIEQATNRVRGRLCFAKGGLRKCFTTENQLASDERIDITLIDGPFKHLQGHWHFSAIDESSSRVLLNLEFEFSTPFLSLVFGPLFEQVAGKLVDAFEERARKIL